MFRSWIETSAVPEIVNTGPFVPPVSVVPGSASTSSVPIAIVNRSDSEPVSFSVLFPVLIALTIFVHGVAWVHAALSVPPALAGATYATASALAHAPVGRHASEGHSALSVHPRHVSSPPQTGVNPEHAPASPVMHWTQTPGVVPAWVSHAGVEPEQLIEVVHACGVSPLGPPSIRQL